MHVVDLNLKCDDVDCSFPLFQDELNVFKWNRCNKILEMLASMTIDQIQCESEAL